VNGKALANALADGSALAMSAQYAEAAGKLNDNTKVGDADRPVYFNNGIPVACEKGISAFVGTYNTTVGLKFSSAISDGRPVFLQYTVGVILPLTKFNRVDSNNFTCEFKGFNEDNLLCCVLTRVNGVDSWTNTTISDFVKGSSQGAPNGAIGSSASPLSQVWSTTFKGNADTASRLSSSIDEGSDNVPVYYNGSTGKPTACGRRFAYAVNASGQPITTQYKICVGAIGTDADTLYFT
jgi:hypothetical protein